MADDPSAKAPTTPVAAAKPAVTAEQKKYSEDKIAAAKKARQEAIAAKARKVPAPTKSPIASTDSTQVLTREQLLGMHKAEIAAVASDRGYKMTFASRESMATRFLEQQDKDPAIKKPSK